MMIIFLHRPVPWILVQVGVMSFLEHNRCSEYVAIVQLRCVFKPCRSVVMIPLSSREEGRTVECRGIGWS